MTSADSIDFVHTGPGTLSGRYLRTFWHPIYIAADLLPGWAKPLRIMSEDFTLYRGESGGVHLVGFRCAHRGTQLSTGWVEDDCIRCLYHGWKYDGNGRCVEQPGEAQPFANTVQIPSCPTQEYLGLIFAYLGPGEPPALPRYSSLERDGVVEVSTYTRACNYFNNIENGVDLYHVAWAHRDAHVQHSLDYVPGAMNVFESDWGITAAVTLRNGSIRTNQFGMPNVLHFVASQGRADNWSQVFAWRIPIDDTRHISFDVRWRSATGETAVSARGGGWDPSDRNPADISRLSETVLRGDVRMRDVDVPGILVNVQDEVTQVGQGTFADREHERRGATDMGVVLLRQIWERELRAFAEGRPLAQWSFPKQLAATSGR